MLSNRNSRYLLKHQKALKPHKYLDIFANLGRPRNFGKPRTLIPSTSEAVASYGNN